MASNMRNNVPQGRQSGKARVDFRTTPKGIVPNSVSVLSRLILEPAMSAALTHAGAKLVVELDAGGTRVLLADQRTNQLIGGPEDLQKLGSIRAFVNRERKEAAGVEAAKDVTQLAFLAEKFVKDNTAGFNMKPVDNSYGAAIRPLHSALQQSVENYKRVEENTSLVNRTVFEPELKRIFTGIGNAYTAAICLLTKGENTKGQLKKLLFDEGVPDWCHSRFVSKSFTLERTGDLGKIFFPTDPTKGLALSVEEWRSEDFAIKQGPLLRDSHLGYELLANDKFIRAMTGIAETVPLDDKENPQVAKLLGAKLVAMPPADSAERIIELGSKSKNGFKFPSPSMDTVNGAIIALSTALLRVYSANLQSVDLVGDYYAFIAPGAVKREDVTPTNNFYVQWGKTEAPSSVWNQAVKGGPDDMTIRHRVWRWLRTELRFSEIAPAGKALAKALSLTDAGGVPKQGSSNSGKLLDGDPENLSLDAPASDSREATELTKPFLAQVLLRDLKDTEVPFWIEFQERVFPPNVGKKKQQMGVALTPLSAPGKTLLNKVKTISPFVAGRMLQWLRSFSDERLQLAAIRVTNAEFDDIFSSPFEEEDYNQSEQDWNETEA